MMREIAYLWYLRVNVFDIVSMSATGIVCPTSALKTSHLNQWKMKLNVLFLPLSFQILQCLFKFHKEYACTIRFSMPTWFSSYVAV